MTNSTVGQRWCQYQAIRTGLSEEVIASWLACHYAGDYHEAEIGLARGGDLREAVLDNQPLTFKAN